MTADPKIHHVYLTFKVRGEVIYEHISCGLHRFSAYHYTTTTSAVTCKRCRRSSHFKSAAEVEAAHARAAAAAQAESPAS